MSYFLSSKIAVVDAIDFIKLINRHRGMNKHNVAANMKVAAVTLSNLAKSERFAKVPAPPEGQSESMVQQVALPLPVAATASPSARGDGQILAPLVEARGDGQILAPLVEARGDGPILAPLVEARGDGQILAPLEEAFDDGHILAPLVEARGDGPILAPLEEAFDDGHILAPLVEARGDGQIMAHLVQAAPSSSLVLPPCCFAVTCKNASMYGKKMRDVHMAGFSVESDKVIRFRSSDGKVAVGDLLVGVGRYSSVKLAQKAIYTMMEDKMASYLISPALKSTRNYSIKRFALFQIISNICTEIPNGTLVLKSSAGTKSKIDKI